jgi:hypothetical protein
MYENRTMKLVKFIPRRERGSRRGSNGGDGFDKGTSSAYMET